MSTRSTAQRGVRLWNLSHLAAHEQESYNKLHQAWDAIRALTEDVEAGEEQVGRETLADLNVQLRRVETAMGLVNLHLSRLRRVLTDLHQQGTLPE